MTLVRVFVFACVCAVLMPAPTAAQQPAPGNKPEQQEQQKPAEPPKYEETVIVSASKTEEKLVNAPATVSVIGPQVIESAPTQNFADLLRSVPGINVTQVSARDINITSRGATGTLATGQLALVDGRSLYQDFFGFVMWDFLPVNFDEIKQIEVIRGPASAVWGANALNGVVNVITKSPREIQGSSFTLGFGAIDRETGNSDQSTGSLWYINGTHAGAPSASWSYKISAGGYSSDPLPRPTGVIPGSATGQTYPAFSNTGTTQPKFDSRVDYDFEDGQRRLTFAGGVVGTEGIMHSGIGPFDIQSGSVMGYFKTGFTKGALRAQFFTNVLNGDASNLLAIGADGKPIHFDFGTNTYDFEVGNASTLGARHVLSYGGNFRYNAFDLSLAPNADDRKEGGVYLQDEMFLHEMFRLVLGGRVDAFSNLDDAVFSPRAAVLIKPMADHTVRFSFNRAYRAPSVINEALEATILNQANLGALHPLLANFVFPITAVGNPDITEQRMDAYEIGYTGVIGGRVTLSAAFYHNSLTKDINFAQVGVYTATNPPPTWPAPLRPLLPVLNLLAAQGRGIPCCVTYLNLGDYTQQGVELGLDAAINRNFSAFVNYSWQGDPDPENAADIRELNLPPTNRVNAGVNFNYSRFLGNVSVTYQDEAFWQDVLDSRFHGTTDSNTLVNAGFGVRFADDKLTTSVKVVNLANEEIQQHVFGDVLKRQIVGEVKVRF
ncbi:MAG: TonB-dependent receptor [Acidobacteria bacterium]|nr:TonB-dependent receptor [Acidobacteriota bacterium]